MTTKSYLLQINRLQKMINNKLSEIYQLRVLSTNIGVSLKADMIKSSSETDKIGSCVAKIVDAENEAQKQVQDLISKQKYIIGQIEKIEDTMQYQVIFSKYIEQKTFEEIAEDCNYSVRQIIRIHSAALNTFGDMYGSEYANDVIECHS